MRPTGWAGTTASRWSGTSSASLCWRSISRVLGDTGTFATSKANTLRAMQTELMFSAGGSPANLTPMPASDEARRMTATSGLKCVELLERFNHVTWWERTFAASLLGATGWWSTRCWLTWKPKGIGRSRRLSFQLAVKTPPTEGIGSGLLPTPMAQSDRETTEQSTKDRQAKYGGTKRAMYLSNVGSPGLLPGPEEVEEEEPEKMENLEAIVGLLPTPRASEHKGVGPIGSSSHNADVKHGYLGATLQQRTGQSFQLSHRYVLEMMGFPTWWCDIPMEQVADIMRPKSKTGSGKKPSRARATP